MMIDSPSPAIPLHDRDPPRPEPGAVAAEAGGEDLATAISADHRRDLFRLLGCRGREGDPGDRRAPSPTIPRNRRDSLGPGPGAWLRGAGGRVLAVGITRRASPRPRAPELPAPALALVVMVERALRRARRPAGSLPPIRCTISTLRGPETGGAAAGAGGRIRCPRSPPAEQRRDLPPAPEMLGPRLPPLTIVVGPGAFGPKMQVDGQGLDSEPFPGVTSLKASPGSLAVAIPKAEYLAVPRAPSVIH